MRRVMLMVLIGFGAAGAAFAAEDHRGIGHRLQQVREAYFDLLTQYPSEYTCEMRSPELFAAMDANARSAWGNGHVLVSRTPQALRLNARGIAQPGARVLFDLALGLWQVRLGAELAALHAYLPGALTALAAGVAAAPLTHAAYEETAGDRIRCGLTARGPNHPIQELRFDLTTELELRGVSLRNKDGGGLEVELESRRFPMTDNRWLVTALKAATTKPDGATEVLQINLDYTAVRGAVLLRLLEIRREDGAGRLLYRNSSDVNPISFEFRNCQITPTESR